MQGPRVYWSDWTLNPRADESGGGADVAAIATYSALGGRISWFGLRLGQAATPADQERLDRLVQNGIAWAAAVPTAAPAAWPGASRAALAFTLDVEDQPQNALHMAAFLRGRDLPGTFFVVSRLVMEDQALGQALREAGEVGSQTSDHTPLQGLTAQDQRVRLRRSSTEIEDWTGVAPLGLRPPEETFDPNTLDAWQRAGGTYLVAANESRSASPEIHRVGEGTQVLLPRLLKDDYNIIVQDRVLRGFSLGQALLEGIRKMRAIGGLAIVAGHTQIIREGPRIAALATVADAARAQGDWWIARTSDIATWWTTRSETTLTFGSPTEGAGRDEAGVSEVVVTAPPDRGVEDLWVDIVIPGAPDGLIPLVQGRSVDFQRTDWGMRVPIGSLPAGATRRVTYLVLPDEGSNLVLPDEGSNE
jgi:peptidoglycan/xylan/chitin deacetylase (PgdA/CDA1 family)